VFVGNLSFDVTREELIEAMSAAGRVLDAKVPVDRETGRPRGFAFVEFESEEVAQRSIQMLNGRELKGRALRVNPAEDRPPRAPGAPPSRPSFRPGPMPPPDSVPDFGRPERRRSFGKKKEGRKSEEGRRSERRPRRDFDDYDDR
jgi:RNA recognition motif-containing protein